VLLIGYLVKNVFPICLMIPYRGTLFPVWCSICSIKDWILLHEPLEKSLFCSSMNGYDCILGSLLLSKISMPELSIYSVITLNVCCSTDGIRNRQYSYSFTSWNREITIDPTCECL